MQGQTSSYVLSTLITAPASGLLTTLEHVKDELDMEDSDTSNDDRLERFITEESSHIARYCNRVFGFATWQDVFRPQRGVSGEGVRGAVNPLLMKRFPLVASVVSFTGNTHSTNTIDGIASTAGLDKGQAVFGAGITPGTTITAVINNGIMLSEPATATAAGVALSTSLAVLETVAGVATWLLAGTDFEIDQGSKLPGDEGISALYRLNELGHPRTWPAAQISVWYQAGYNLPGDADQDVPMPTDLESACILAVVRRYTARGRDPLLIEKSQPGTLGTQRYWMGMEPGQRGSLAPEIAAMVEHYRVPVVG